MFLGQLRYAKDGSEGHLRAANDRAARPAAAAADGRVSGGLIWSFWKTVAEMSDQGESWMGDDTDDTAGYFAAFICLRGDVDNLGLTKEGSFGLLDSQERSWVCWQVKEEALASEMGDVLTDVPELQTKLMESGFFDTGGLHAVVSVTRLPEPISWEEQLEWLRENLGNKSDEDEEDDDSGEEWKRGL
jgi:hypothetical protein